MKSAGFTLLTIALAFAGGPHADAAAFAGTAAAAACGSLA